MDPLERYRGWFYAAAGYNVLWGTGALLLAPGTGWRVVGLLVLVYAPAYWWAARAPQRHAHLVAIAALGKLLGPLCFAAGLATGAVPVSLGLVVLTNDLLWWPALAAYLRGAARAAGGWQILLSGR